MILSDKDLSWVLGIDTDRRDREPSPASCHLGFGSLSVEPLEDPELQIQPSSIDLRLGQHFTRFKHHFGHVEAAEGIRPEHMERDERPPDGFVTVRPGEFLLGHTRETVKLSTAMTARVEGRSSIGRLGLLVHATAGYIDPGFKGQITLEIKNLSMRSIRIPIGMRVCQIVIETMTSAAAAPYGSKGRGSRYQGQTGANPYAKIAGAAATFTVDDVEPAT